MCVLTEVEEELSKEKELLGDGISPDLTRGRFKCIFSDYQQHVFVQK